jgi:hypothetical protein
MELLVILLLIGSVLVFLPFIAAFAGYMLLCIVGFLIFVVIAATVQCLFGGK